MRIRDFISLSMALILSLPSSLALSAPAASRPIDDPAIQLDEDLSRAWLNAIYPGAPGYNQRLTPQLVGDLGQRLEIWRQKLTRQLNEILSYGSETPMTEGRERTLLLIKAYYDMVERLETIRTLSGESVRPADWRTKYAIRLPLRSLAAYDFAGALAQIEDAGAMNGVHFEARLEANDLILNPKLNMAMNIEETRLAQGQSDQDILKLAQFFAASALVQNLAQFRFLLNDQRKIEIPNSLASRFPLLSAQLENAEQERDKNKAALFRKRFGVRATTLFTHLHVRGLYLSTTDMLEEITRLFPYGDKVDLDDVIAALRNFEATDGGILLRDLIKLVHIGPLNEDSAAKALARVIAETQSLVIHNHLLTPENIQQQKLSLEKVEAIRSAIDRARAVYQIRLEPELRATVREVLADVQKLELTARQQYVTQFINKAREFSKISRDTDIEVDPGALSAAYHVELAALPFSGSAREKLMTVIGAPNYVQARALFHRLLLNQFLWFQHPRFEPLQFDAQHQVVLDHARKWLKEASWNDKEWTEALRRFSSLKEWSQDIGPAAKRDLESWLTAGDRLGFFRFNKPRVKDFAFKKDQAKAYFGTLKARLLAEYPLFNIQVAGAKKVSPYVLDNTLPVTEPAPSEVSLAEAIDLNHYDPKALVERGLKRAQSNLEEDLLVVAGEKRGVLEQVKFKVGLVSEEELSIGLQRVLQSSIAIANQLAPHPAQAERYKALITGMSEPSTERRIWDRLDSVNGRIMEIMIAISLVDWLATRNLALIPKIVSFFSKSMRINLAFLPGVTRFLVKSVPQFLGTSLRGAFPFLHSMNWLINGLFAGALAEGAYTAFVTAPAERDQMERFASCSLTGPCLLDTEAVASWNEKSKEKKATWVKDLIFAGLFIGVLSGIGIAGQTWQKRKIDRLSQRLETKMRDIGFQNNRYSFTDPQLQDAADGSLARLDKSVHPAFDPHRPLADSMAFLDDYPGGLNELLKKGELNRLPPSLAFLRDVPGGLENLLNAEPTLRFAPRRSSPALLAEIAKTSIARRIQSTIEEVKALVTQQRRYWEQAYVELEPDLLVFGWERRMPSIKEIKAAEAKIKLERARNQISPEVKAQMDYSLGNIRSFLIPHITRAQSDPVYAALLEQVAGFNFRPSLTAEDHLAYFGHAFQDAMRFETGDKVRVQVFKSERPYKIANPKWLEHADQFLGKNYPSLLPEPAKLMLTEIRRRSGR